MAPTLSKSSGEATVTDEVMGRIRALLMTGALAPGSRIDQNELARRFDVSIIPIREALGRLASVGLVEIVSHRGAFVPEVSADELIDLYTVRELLEEQAARIAVERLTEPDLQELDQLADAMADAAQAREFDRFLMLNRALHFTLYRASKRRHMLQVIERMWDLSARYAHLQLQAIPERASQSISEVRAIVAACRRRDRDEVALLVRYKVHQTSVGLIERMTSPAKRVQQPANGPAKARRGLKKPSDR